MVTENRRLAEVTEDAEPMGHPRYAQSGSIQLLSYQFVDKLRVRLSLRSFHHLAYEKRRNRLLASTVLLDLLGISGNYLIEDLFDSRGIA